MDEKKVRNYVGQILDLTFKLKNQPPTQRYKTADEISRLARLIRGELDANTHK